MRYPVAKTDMAGDVIFFYSGIFDRFELTLYIPPIGYEQDPNRWMSRQFDSPSLSLQARKLWVPRRYQWWSILMTGNHISKYLFLVAHVVSKA